jgi:hypothetical protein
MPQNFHNGEEEMNALIWYRKFKAQNTKFYLTYLPQKKTGLRNLCVFVCNSSIERVEEFKYLGTKLTDQNSIQAEIKSRLKLGNACIIRFRIFCLPECYPKI